MFALAAGVDGTAAGGKTGGVGGGWGGGRAGGRDGGGGTAGEWESAKDGRVGITSGRPQKQSKSVSF